MHWYRILKTAELWLLCLAVVLTVNSARRLDRADAGARHRAAGSYAKLPFWFEQLPVRDGGPTGFVARRGRQSLWLGAGGSVMLPPDTAGHRENPLRLALAGSDQQVRGYPIDALPMRVNYFLGSDPRGWRTNCPAYERVRYDAVYPGIDLVYYGSPTGVEYDYLVHPGANPERIRLAVQGADDLKLTADGDLVVSYGTETLVEHKPRLYQERDGRRQVVPGSFVLASNREVTFSVGAYDPTTTLIIDPILDYSTLAGHAMTLSIALDSNRNAYVTDGVSTPDFLTTPGAFDRTFHGKTDSFILKLNSSGTAAVYASYIGGSEYDESRGIAVDSDGSAYLSGWTQSLDFPTTPGAFQRTFRGGYSDAFVLKLSPSGSSLVYSTYLGGTALDDGAQCHGLTVDAQGCAYVTGGTGSLMTFPVTPGAYVGGTGTTASYVAKLNSTGSGLVYCALIRSFDGEDIALDSSGNAYIAGGAGQGFPVTQNAFQTQVRGDYDAAVVKLKADGSALLYATLLGGSDHDGPSGIAVDMAGRVFICGSTFSFDFPTTPNAYQKLKGDQLSYWGDAFAACLSADGSSLVYSTYLGGIDDDWANDIDVDLDGRAYVCGATNSADFPVSPNGYMSKTPGILGGYICELNATGSALVYSALMGGADGYGIVAVGPGSVYVCGSGSSNTITTPGAYVSDTQASDGWITHMLLEPGAPSDLTALTTGTSTIDLAWITNSASADNYSVERTQDGQTFSVIATLGRGSNSFSDTGLTPGTSYSYRVRSTLSNGDVSWYSNVASTTTSPVPPAAPSGLTATALTSSSIRLTWTDASNNETSFEVERRSGASNFTLVAALGANQTQFDDTGLSGVTTYTYQVRAVNAGGPSAYSNSASATTPAGPPANPTNLIVTTLLSSRVDLAWAAGDGTATTFEIERKPSGGSYALLASVAGGVLTYSDTSIVAGSTYTYRVRAANDNGKSGFSNEVTAAVPPDPPLAPTGLTVNAVTASHVDIGWTGDATASSYEVERKVAGGGFALLATVKAPTTTLSDINVGGGATYTYHVRASNAGGVSPYSADLVVTTPVGAPQPPLSLHTTSVTNLHVDLAWTPADNLATGFTLQRKTGSGSYADLASTANASYSDTTVAAGSTYTYRVRASNSGGSSGYGNPVTVSLAAAAPGAPSNLTLTGVTTARADLSWTAADATAASFAIERKNGSGSYGLLMTVDGSVTTFSDTSVIAGTTYTYRVRASNSAGDSSPSNEVTAIVPTGPLATPTNLMAATVAPFHVDLSWTAGDALAGKYEIERKTGSGSYALLVRINATNASYSDTSVLPSTTYTYHVRATNGNGASGYSNEVQVTTPIPPATAPTSLTATPKSATSIGLSWSGATGQDGYKIERRTGNGAFTQLTFASGNSASYTDTGLSADTAYTYRLRSYNASGDSDSSPEATATTLPLGLTGLSAAAISASRIDVQWTDPNNPAVAAKLERSADGVHFDAPVNIGAGKTQYSDTGLQSNRLYRYRVSASGPGGVSDPTEVVQALTYPAAPTGLMLQSASSNQVTINWGDGSANPSAFQIERSTDGGSTFPQLATTSVGATSYSDTAVTPGATYQYRVRAVNATGASDPAGPVSATVPTPTVDPPGPPSAFTVAGVTKTSVSLSWTPPSGPITGYQLERSLDGGASFQPIATPDASATSATDSGLSSGTTYKYRLRAHNDGGDGAYSPVATAKTLANPPNAPTNLKAAIGGSNEIDLAWQDGGGGTEHFVVERAVGTGGFQALATLSGSTLAYGDKPLQPGTVYHYRVKATSGQGDSSYAGPVDATIPAGGKLTVKGSLNFGVVKNGSTKTLKLTLANTGKGPLAVTVGALAAPFRVTSGAGSVTLQAKKSVVVTVTFTPPAAQSYSNPLSIQNSDPAAPQSITASGKGK